MSDETEIRRSGEADAGDADGKRAGEQSPLQGRAAFIKNWDWQLVTSLNRGSCARGGAQHGFNRETQEACRREWEEKQQQVLTLGETIDFLRQCHRRAPFLFFNGGRFTNTTLALLTAIGLWCASSESGFSRELSSLAANLVVSQEIFLAVTNGASLDSVRDRLGRAARHEFTVVGTNGDYMLMSCLVSVGAGVDLWLLFRDRVLVKAIRPVPPDLETYAYEGTTATRIRSWEIGETGRVRRTIDAPALGRNEIQAMLDALRPTKSEGAESSNVLPAFQISGFFRDMGPRIKQDYEINQKLLDRHDGFRANLSMTAEEVEMLFGKPLRVFSSKSGQTIRIYGDDRDLRVNPQYRFSCLAVAFDKRGHATSIYSHQFFNSEWKK